MIGRHGGGGWSAVLACVMAVVVVVGWHGTAPGSAAVDERPVRRVLVLSLPALGWEDLEGRDLPNLRALFDASALGGLSTRVRSRRTVPADGYATIGAGTRALGPFDADGPGVTGLAFDVDEVVGGRTTGGFFGGGTAGEAFTRRTGRPAGSGLVHLQIAEIQRRNEAALYDAEPGALGDALAGGEVRRGVVANADLDAPFDPIASPFGRQPVSALMGSDGRVPGGTVDASRLLVDDPSAPGGRRLDADAVVDAFREIWDPPGRAVVLVEDSDLLRYDQARGTASTRGRGQLFDETLERLDRLVGRLLDEVDPATDAVLVVGPSPPATRLGLTIAALRAPGVDPGLLTSATTRRDGFVQLVDVAPTILDLLGIERPDSMEGRRFEVVAGAGGADTAAREEMLSDADRAARFRDGLVGAMTLLVGIAAAAVTVLAVLALGGRARPRTATVARIGALALLGIVPVTFLARLVPFHEHASVWYWAFVVVGAVVWGAVCELAGRAVGGPGPAVTIGLFGALVVVLGDVVTGAHLQWNSVFGYSPTVAGRFAGLGNQGFALASAAAILLAGLLAARWPGRRGLVAAALTLGVVLVVDGLPFLGADVGGVLAIVPAGAVTLLLLSGRRIRWPTVVVLGVGALAAVGLAGALDLTRPEDSRTHLGRLLERSGDVDGVVTILLRKLSSALATVTGSLWTVVTVIVGLLLWWLWRHRQLTRLVRALPSMRASLIGFTVLAILGLALNDSGVAVPGMMLVALEAVLIALLLPASRRARQGDAAADAESIVPPVRLAGEP